MLDDFLAHNELYGFEFDQKNEKEKAEKEVDLFLKSFPPRHAFIRIKKAYEEKCKKSDEPICRWLISTNVKKKSCPVTRQQKKIRLESLQQAIKNYDFDTMMNADESDLVRIFRDMHRHQNDEFLAKITDIFLQKIVSWYAQDVCHIAGLGFALGMHTEELFPDSKARVLAQNLYESIVGCRTKESAYSARYRLGLLRIWDKKWQGALDVLKEMSESTMHSDKDPVVLRAEYWRYVAAIQLANKPLENALRDKLQKDFPLSLHSLIVTHGTYQSLPETKSLQVRSLNAGLNAALRVIEILLSRQEKYYAKRLLAFYGPKLKEDPVALYSAVLMQRAGGVLESFSFLSGAFRREPGAITKKSLQMMYPKLFVHEGGFDQALTLSIIRQESAFNPAAHSPAGALGLMQVQYATARTLMRLVKNGSLILNSISILGSDIFRS